MTHREKVACFKKLLQDRGYWKSNAIPPMWWLVWQLGFELPPPYFLPFPIAAIAAGLPFAVIWGVFMRWTVWADEMSLGAVAMGAAIAGSVFGLVMAAIWRQKANGLGLPSWDKFPEESLNAS